MPTKQPTVDITNMAFEASTGAVTGRITMTMPELKMPTVVFTHEYPPIPTRDHDWRAGFDGREEEGRDGWGATKLAAAVDLFHQCETIEDTMAAIVGIMRADLDMIGEGLKDEWCEGYERAIRTVEGIL